jgi:hypothetical protein
MRKDPEFVMLHGPSEFDGSCQFWEANLVSSDESWGTLRSNRTIGEGIGDGVPASRPGWFPTRTVATGSSGRCRRRICLQRKSSRRRSSVVSGDPQAGSDCPLFGPSWQSRNRIFRTCHFVPVGMSVNNNDSSPLFVTVNLADYGSMYGTFNKQFDHKLSGIGDKAYWDWGHEQGADSPQVNAEKGKIDCMVTLNGNVDHTTLSYTESGGNPVVTTASGEVFAKKLGVICADVFKGK